MTIEPAEYDPLKTPAIVLAGKNWPIPELSIRQLREVRGPLMELHKRLFKAMYGASSPEIAKLKASATFETLDRNDFERLVVEPVYWGLTKAHPTLKLEEFLDWSVDEQELVSAVFVVQQQSGLFVPGQKSEAAPVADGEASGEAKAA